MTFKTRISLVLCTLLLFALGAEAATPPPALTPVSAPAAGSPPAPASAQLGTLRKEIGFDINNPFTAQRRPRVTVYPFEDNNEEAKQAKYGASVEAMLVTFLKRKSQFVVVEREKLGRLMEEKQRIQHGMIQLAPGDTHARELLEKLDAIILGSVTLLDVATEAHTVPPHAEKKEEVAAQSGSEAPETVARADVSGPRIEVDAKLLSRFDGRIIAVAQRSGPVWCLRSIVERLGVALEQEFLRPYYGSLKFNLTNPEYVRIHLTPILMDDALDEEKPPIERSASVTINTESDTVNAWTTDPTTYTIENILGGWYSMRLERPGYRGDGLGTENSRWEVRNLPEGLKVYERKPNLPLDRIDPVDQRFLVYVKPLSVTVVPGDDLNLVFTKMGGSITPHTKRQYVDFDFSSTPRKVLLMGGTDLDLNRFQRPDEYADDPRCDLFDEKPIRPESYGRTFVAAGEKFDFDSFKGGELVIDDYKGEIVPAGKYRMVLWEPNYFTASPEVTVHDRDTGKIVSNTLIRLTGRLELDTTGARPTYRAVLAGKDTHQQVAAPLTFLEPKEQSGLPVDVYTASTNIPGLEAWQRSAEVSAGASVPPRFDPESPIGKPALVAEPKQDHNQSPKPSLRIKTRFGVAGRLEIGQRALDLQSTELFVDRDVEKILERLASLEPERQEGEGGAPVGRRKTTSKLLGFFRRAPEGIEKVSNSEGAASSPLAERQLAQAPKPNQPLSPLDDVPKEAEALYALLAEHLVDVDLLLLDGRDMEQLRRLPAAAAVIERYVAAGGALFAFVTQPGRYGRVVGAPLDVEKLGKRTKRFELASGAAGGIVPTFQHRRVKVKSKRALPVVAEPPISGPWRVLAYGKGHKEPRILELGRRNEGGYVALWLDDPKSFRGVFGGTVKEVEETRANVEGHVLDWARYLVARRYDKGSQQCGPATPSTMP